MPKKLLLIGLFAFIFLLFLHPINSGDFFHHLNTGRYIAEHLSLPYTDDLSFTAYGQPWVAYSWGAGLIYFLLYSTFGPAGITVFLALCGVLASFFLYKILRDLKVKLFPAIVLTLLGASLISLRWPTRPEVLGPTFLIALVWLLFTLYKKPNVMLNSFQHPQEKEIPKPVRNDKYQYLLPLFFWLWGIIYGSSTFLGIGVYLLFIVINKFFTRRDLVLFALSLLTSLLNGYGLRSFLYIFQIPSIAGYVGEWLPLHKTLNPDFPDLVLFYQMIVLAYLLFTFFYLVVIIIVFFKKRHLLKKHLFLFILSLTIFAPFYTSRFINLAPLLVIPILGLSMPPTGRKRSLFLITASLIIIIALYTRFTLYPLGVGIQKSPFQQKVPAFLKSHSLNGNIYASQEIGAFLSFELPGSKIFVDTRDDLYIPTGIFEKMRAVSEGHASLLALLDTYKADIVIGDLGTGRFYQPLLYSPEWSLLYLTDGYFVVVRNTLLKGKNITPLTAIDPLRIPANKPGRAKEAEIELSQLIETDPDAEENKVRLVELLLTQNKAAEAKKLLRTTDLTGFFGARQPLIDMDSELLKTRVFLANNECKAALGSLQKAESLRYHKFIFYPQKQIPSTADEYWGDYYMSCKNDPKKATEYYTKFILTVGSPLDKFRVEKKLQNSSN